MWTLWVGDGGSENNVQRTLSVVHFELRVIPKSGGKRFSSTDVLNNFVKGGLITIKASLIIFGGIASGPADFWY